MKSCRTRCASGKRRDLRARWAAWKRRRNDKIEPGVDLITTTTQRDAARTTRGGLA